MTTDPILHFLNDAQKQSVTADVAALLVLAGAGSGKTRVLVHRIAWLIRQQGLSPHHLMAVTFTNKAAHEMKQRIESLLGRPANSMWIGTFHGLAHRLLRTHAKDAGLNDNFQILDSDDQLRIIKRIIREKGLDENEWQLPRNRSEALSEHPLFFHESAVADYFLGHHLQLSPVKVGSAGPAAQVAARCAAL